MTAGRRLLKTMYGVMKELNGKQHVYYIRNLIYTEIVCVTLQCIHGG
jgi:hypothetical protein